MSHSTSCEIENARSEIDDPKDEFEDDRGNYVTNEVALDYNAGFTGLLAAFLSK